VLKEITTLKETNKELKGFKPATSKMLKLAKALAKETGLKLPKEKTFEEVRKFIKTALEKKKEGLGTCKCGGKIVSFSKGWKCEKCGSVVWNTFMGKRITHRQALELFRGKEVVLKGLKSKNGKRFNARIRLEGKEGKLKIVEFAN